MGISVYKISFICLFSIIYFVYGLNCKVTCDRGLSPGFGWTAYNGYCYQVLNMSTKDDTSWLAANKQCTFLNSNHTGHLLVEEDYETMLSLIINLLDADVSLSAFIYLGATTIERTTTWINGHVASWPFANCTTNDTNHDPNPGKKCIGIEARIKTERCLSYVDCTEQITSGKTGIAICQYFVDDFYNSCPRNVSFALGPYPMPDGESCLYRLPLLPPISPGRLTWNQLFCEAPFMFKDNYADVTSFGQLLTMRNIMEMLWAKDVLMGGYAIVGLTSQCIGCSSSWIWVDGSPMPSFLIADAIRVVGVAEECGSLYFNSSSTADPLSINLIPVPCNTTGSFNGSYFLFAIRKHDSVSKRILTNVSSVTPSRYCQALLSTSNSSCAVKNMTSITFENCTLNNFLPNTIATSTSLASIPSSPPIDVYTTSSYIVTTSTSLIKSTVYSTTTMTTTMTSTMISALTCSTTSMMASTVVSTMISTPTSKIPASLSSTTTPTMTSTTISALNSSTTSTIASTVASPTISTSTSTIPASLSSTKTTTMTSTMISALTSSTIISALTSSTTSTMASTVASPMISTPTSKIPASLTSTTTPTLTLTTMTSTMISFTSSTTSMMASTVVSTMISTPTSKIPASLSSTTTPKMTSTTRSALPSSTNSTMASTVATPIISTPTSKIPASLTSTKMSTLTIMTSKDPAEELSNLANEGVSQANVSSTLKKMTNIISDNKNNINAGELKSISILLNNSANFTLDQEAFKDFMHVIDIVSSTHEVSDRGPTPTHVCLSSFDTCQRILKSMDVMLKNLNSSSNASNIYTGDKITLHTESIDCKNRPPLLGLQKLSNKSFGAIRSDPEPTDTLVESVTLSHDVACNGSRTVFAVFDSMELFHQYDSRNSTFDRCRRETLTASNRVFHVKLLDRNGLYQSQLLQPVSLTFKERPKFQKYLHAKYKGGFWKGNEGWSTRGCDTVPRKYEYIHSGFSEFTCSHLSDFTLLVDMNPSDPVLCDSFLSILSNVLCSVSVASLVLCIVVFSYGIFANRRIVRRNSPKLRENYLRLYFLTTWAIFYLLFILFSDQQLLHIDDVSCSLIAAVTYTFLLSILMQTFVKAVNYCVRFYLIQFYFTPTRFSEWVASVVFATVPTMGLPILGTIFIRVFSPDAFERGDFFCWIRPELALWFITIPISIIIFTDLILFCLLLWSIYKSHLIESHSNRQVSSLQFRRNIVVLITVQTTLGLPWVLQYLTVGEPDVNGFHYCFTLFNGLQGLIVSVSISVLEKPGYVTKTVKKMFRCRSRISQRQSRTSEQWNTTSTDSSTSTPQINWLFKSSNPNM